MSSPIEILEKKKQESIKRLQKKFANKKIHVNIGVATCEIAAGSKAVMDVFEQSVKAGVDMFIGKRGCRGACYLEPIVEVVIDGQKPVLYANVDEEKAKRILDEHIKKGKIVEDLVANLKS